MSITLDYTNLMNLITEREIESAAPLFKDARQKVLKGDGEGGDYLGWVDLPAKMPEEMLDEIMQTAKKIRENTDVFISIGIGGSYLGARAAIEALLPNFHNRTQKPEIIFLGNSISPRYIADVMKHIKGKKIFVNVISKSGATTEPALAFRVVREWMIENYGEKETYERIIATTDAKKGALRKLADQKGIKTYVIPDNVGGRFSVLTPVGLLPIAVAGIDVKKMMQGAKEGVAEYRDQEDIFKNPSAMYAILRNILYNHGKSIELLVNFEPQLHYVAEWWKQLFGESEGKEHKSLFPASCDFTTDLHSMGQWIQQGRREIFETFLNVEDPGVIVMVKEDPDNLDNLNYLAGKTFGYVNRQAMLGTRHAHKEGECPNMTLTIPGFTPHTLGKLFYFFEWAVAISGYMLEVNPFNQPGVESYKKNMFALLGRPGFETDTERLEKELSGAKQYVVQAPSKVKTGK